MLHQSIMFALSLLCEMRPWHSSGLLTLFTPEDIFCLTLVKQNAVVFLKYNLIY